MATFTYTPDRNFTEDVSPRVLITQFDDGYSQRLNNSINPLNKSWNLTFQNRANNEADNITQFLEARNGTEAFDWTPPGYDASVKVICKKWGSTWTSHFSKSISATFEIVYEV